MKTWSVVGGIATFVIGLGILFPSDAPLLLQFKNLLIAAVGNIDMSTLRLWQNRGGFSQTLAQGTRSADVRLIQTSLATDPNIYPEGNVTGYFGPATQNALSRFQNQYQLAPTGIFDTPTRKTLNQIFFRELCPTSDAAQPDLSLSHVTRSEGLPTSYIPQELVDISLLVSTQGVICVQKATANALVALFAAARAEKMSLRVCSGYRGPDVQKYISAQWFALEGANAFNEVALPYHSEHQTGTTVDLTGSSVGYQCADDSFGSTNELRWLMQNAWRYGFNMSYPANHKDGSVTEYVYEPWHWRYVGTTLSATLHAREISYNEYLESNTPDAALVTIPF